MSTGLVICSHCKHEVHQDLDHKWTHCDTGTPICHGASAKYPDNKEEIQGTFCGRDDSYGLFTMGMSPDQWKDYLAGEKSPRYPGNGNRKERRAIAQARRKANKS